MNFVSPLVLFGSDVGVPDGYSFLHVPTQPGHHQISSPIWRPCGSSREETACKNILNFAQKYFGTGFDQCSLVFSHIFCSAFFIGGAAQLKSKNLIFSTAKVSAIYLYLLIETILLIIRFYFCIGSQDERIRISTTSVGEIKLELDIMLRNFLSHNIQWGDGDGMKK
jgi:hypothetical protein